MIVFIGQYDGNIEVYIMFVMGGELLWIIYMVINSCDDLGDCMGFNNIVMIWILDG